MKKKATLSAEAYEADAAVVYILRLYITGFSPRSARAISNIRKICEEHLEGRYDLEVVNIAEQPAQAQSEQILAAPTLIKKWPLPTRRFIGDMSQSDRIMLGLDLHDETQKPLARNANAPL
jgi:circadian clock protein KaiB